MFLTVCVVGLAVVGGCGAGDDGGPADRATEQRTASAVPRGSCDEPSPIGDAPGVGGPEVQGYGTGAQLYGLIMSREFPLTAGPNEVKIVWRMTGSGPLELAAYDPKGKKVPLA